MDLPYELWLHTFTFLEPNDLGSVARCSKLFHDLASSDIIWKPILIRRFGDRLRFPFKGSTLEPRAKNFFLQFNRRSIVKMNTMNGLVHGLEARIQNSHFYNRSKEQFRDLLFWPRSENKDTNGMNVMCSTNQGSMTFWEFCPLKTQRDFSKVLWMKKRRAGNAQTGKECNTLPFRWRKSYTIKEDGNDIRCLKELKTNDNDGGLFITGGMDRKIRVYGKKKEEEVLEVRKPVVNFRQHIKTRKRGGRRTAAVNNKSKKNKMDRWKLNHQIRAHSGCINTLKVFKNSTNNKGTLVITGSMDRTLRVKKNILLIHFSDTFFYIDLEKLRKEFEAVRMSEKEKHESELQKINDEKKQIIGELEASKKESEDEKLRLESEYEKSISQKDEELEKQRKEQVEEFEDLKRQNAEESQRLQVENSAKLEKLRETFEKEKNEMNESHQGEIDSLTQKLKEGENEALDSMKEKYEEKRRNEKNEHEAELKKLKDEWMKKYSGKMKELTDQQQSDGMESLSALRLEYETKIQNLVEKNERKAKEMKDGYEKNFDEYKSEQTSKLDNLKSEYDEKIHKMKESNERLAQEIETLKTEGKENKNLIEKLEMELSQNQNDKHLEIDELKSKLLQKDELLGKNRKESDEKMDEYIKMIKSLEEQVEKSKDDMERKEEEFETSKAELEKSHSEEIERLKNELEEERKRNEEEMNEKSKQEEEKLGKMREEKESLKLRLKETEEGRINEKQGLERKIELLEQQLRNSQGDSSSLISEKDDLIRDLELRNRELEKSKNEEREKMRKEYESQLESLKMSKEEEKNGFEATLDKLRKEMEELKMKNEETQNQMNETFREKEASWGTEKADLLKQINELTSKLKKLSQKKETGEIDVQTELTWEKILQDHSNQSEEEINRLEKELADREGRAEEERRVLREALEKSQGELLEKESVLKKTESELTRKNDLLNRCKLAIVKFKESNQTLKSDLSSFQKRHETQLKVIDLKVREKDDKIENLEKKILDFMKIEKSPKKKKEVMISPPPLPPKEEEIMKIEEVVEKEEVKDVPEKTIELPPFKQTAQYKNFAKAKESLKNLKTMEIKEINSYVRPPKLVTQIVRALLLLLGKEEHELENWMRCKRWISSKMKVALNTYEVKGGDKVKGVISITKEITKERAYKCCKFIGVIYDFIVSVRDAVLEIRRRRKVGGGGKGKKRIATRKKKKSGKGRRRGNQVSTNNGRNGSK